jgi:hypothetical protein
LFFKELPAGVYKVLVTAEGFYDYHDDVAGRADQVIRVHYPLKPLDDREQPPREEPPPPEDEKPRLPPGEEPGEKFRYEKQEGERSIKDALGGGDIIFFRTGDSDSQPNDITILSYYTRYIGAGNIYDEKGALIGRNEPIMVKTIFKQTFSTLIEYQDSNLDGLFNKAEKPDENNVIRHEPVYKAVSLKTAWHKSEINKQIFDDNVMEFSFDLTAKELPYRILGDPEMIDTRGKLDLVKFTFHVYMKKDAVTKEDIPVYRIDVETGEDEKIIDVKNAEKEDERDYKGTRISTKVKYDYLINGWNYDSTNTNPMLYLDMDISLLRAGDGRIAMWMQERELEDAMRYKERCQYRDKDDVDREFYLEESEEGGEYQYVEDEYVEDEMDRKHMEEEEMRKGTHSRSGMMEDEPPGDLEGEDALTLKDFEDPELIKDNQLRFADDLYKLGGFSWLNNVTADGKDVLIKFQIQNVGWIKKFIDGKYFVGMFIKGGFNLPGASKIYHDPTFAADMYELDISSEPIEASGLSQGKVILISVILMVIIVIVLASFFGSIKSDKERKMPPPKFNNDTSNKTVMDKDKFAPKKSEEDEYYESFYIDWDD